MKTLQAFWRWVDNEKPDTLTVVQKACGGKGLTPLARTALDFAADAVWAMHHDAPPGYSIRSALDSHRDDLRDVSLALLPALEKVNERRGATVRKIVEQWSAHTHAVRVPAGENIFDAAVAEGIARGQLTPVDQLRGLAERVKAKRAGNPAPEPEPLKSWQCVRCGISSADEPSVLHFRADGLARCNDCQRNRRWATNEGGKRV